MHTLCMSELAKADGALTCCSILIGAPGGAEQLEALKSKYKEIAE